MDDKAIIELFFARSEGVIKELDLKYGKLCHKISSNILHNQQDAEECVNDAYLGIWNTIPPERPNPLLAFLCKIVRNLSVQGSVPWNSQGFCIPPGNRFFPWHDIRVGFEEVPVIKGNVAHNAEAVGEDAWSRKQPYSAPVGVTCRYQCGLAASPLISTITERIPANPTPLPTIPRSRRKM